MMTYEDILPITKKSKFTKNQRTDIAVCYGKQKAPLKNFVIFCKTIKNLEFVALELYIP